MIKFWLKNQLLEEPSKLQQEKIELKVPKFKDLLPLKDLEEKEYIFKKRNQDLPKLKLLRKNMKSSQLNGENKELHQPTNKKMMKRRTKKILKIKLLLLVTQHLFKPKILKKQLLLLPKIPLVLQLLNRKVLLNRKQLLLLLILVKKLLLVVNRKLMLLKILLPLLLRIQLLLLVIKKEQVNKNEQISFQIFNLQKIISIFICKNFYVKKKFKNIFFN